MKGKIYEAKRRGGQESVAACGPHAILKSESSSAPPPGSSEAEAYCGKLSCSHSILSILNLIKRALLIYYLKEKLYG